MLRTLFGPWSFEANPLYIVLAVGALFFFSMALSFAQGQKRALGQQLGLGLVFVLVGDLILYAAYSALGFPQNYQFNNVAIYSYGFMLMVAFVAASVFLVNRGKKTEWDLSSDTILDFMTFVIIGGILGARLLYVALEWNTQYSPEALGLTDVTGSEALKRALLNIAKINEGGLSFHGGMLGAMLSSWIFCMAKRISFWKLADFGAPAIALGGVFGRIGCFLNGCCYGVATQIVPGVVMKTVTGPLAGEELHPAQLYESFGHLMLFFYLVAAERYSVFRGQSFLRFVIGYSAVRFVVEFFRYDVSAEIFQVLPGVGGVTVAQVASLVTMIAGTILMKVLEKKYAPPPDAEAEKAAPKGVVAPAE